MLVSPLNFPVSATLLPSEQFAEISALLYLFFLILWKLSAASIGNISGVLYVWGESSKTSSCYQSDIWQRKMSYDAAGGAWSYAMDEILFPQRSQLRWKGFLGFSPSDGPSPNGLGLENETSRFGLEINTDKFKIFGLMDSPLLNGLEDQNDPDIQQLTALWVCFTHQCSLLEVAWSTH